MVNRRDYVEITKNTHKISAEYYTSSLTHTTLGSVIWASPFTPACSSTQPPHTKNSAGTHSTLRQAGNAHVCSTAPYTKACDCVSLCISSACDGTSTT
eukprot:m.278949 g.278949  ORF g.278949 m.278949 type:complete len:98 (-) comp19793_c1_seq7:431-724(-)